MTGRGVNWDYLTIATAVDYLSSFQGSSTASSAQLVSAWVLRLPCSIFTFLLFFFPPFRQALTKQRSLLISLHEGKTATCFKSLCSGSANGRHSTIQVFDMTVPLLTPNNEIRVPNSSLFQMPAWEWSLISCVIEAGWGDNHSVATSSV